MKDATQFQSCRGEKRRDMRLVYLINAVEGRPLSPFLLAKTIQHATGTCTKQIKSSALGYTIELSEKEAGKLEGQKIGLQTIAVTKHPFLNAQKGVVYYPAFMFTTEDEILEGLKEENVKEISRILKKGPTKKFEVENQPEKGLTNTGNFVLSFEAMEIPKKVKIGLELVEVRQYIPKPSHCNNCHSWQHSAKFCRNETKCGKCAASHKEEDCEKTELTCCNCKGNHHARSRACDDYKKEEAIIKYATDNKISRREARSRLPSRKAETYAKMAAAPPSSNMEELLQTIINQQKLLLNFLFTGKAHGATIREETTATQVKQPPKQPSQEHLRKYQAELHSEAAKKRSRGSEEAETQNGPTKKANNPETTNENDFNEEMDTEEQPELGGDIPELLLNCTDEKEATHTRQKSVSATEAHKSTSKELKSRKQQHLQKSTTSDEDL